MTKPRPKIPRNTEAQVFFDADRRCCICRERKPSLQLHHIDSNPANNSLENLAVVCIECHAAVTGSPGMGKRYTSTEVRMYKRTWERQVKKGRGLYPTGKPK